MEAIDPERIRGLISIALSSDRGMRLAGREEAAGLGDGAIDELEAILADSTVAAAEREVAIEFLGLLASPRSAESLLTLLESSDEPWQRAHAAWRLASSDQDWVVPRMLLRLKYETDFDTVIWLAKTLAHYGNDAGLGALSVIAAEAPNDTLRASALARREEIARAAGASSADELQRAWNAAEPPAFPQPDRSARFDREVLRWIDRFREFQLRGVDDARFLLERMGTRAAELLGLALSDSNLYIRLHAAQSLKRMGRRGEAAGPALLERLDDPEIAPMAAEALGAVGYAPAQPRLAQLAGGPPGVALDLRLAALRGLGGFADREATAGDASALTALRAALDPSGPLEIQQAAAESLARRGHAEEVLRRLADFLVEPGLDPGTTERVLRTWIVESGETELLTRWDEAGIEPGTIVSEEERMASRRARKALIDSL